MLLCLEERDDVCYLMHLYNMLSIYRMHFCELISQAFQTHTTKEFVGKFLHHCSTLEVNQFDFHGVPVHQQVLQFDVPMEDTTHAANSGINDLLHDLSCHCFVEASSGELDEARQVHAR